LAGKNVSGVTCFHVMWNAKPYLSQSLSIPGHFQSVPVSIPVIGYWLGSPVLITYAVNYVDRDVKLSMASQSVFS